MGGSSADAGPLIGSGTAPDFGLVVTPTSPASAGVYVTGGSALVNGTFYTSTATETLAIAANVSGNPRIDTIILRKDTSLQTVRLAVKQGSPAASPAAAGLTQGAAMWEIPLADIAVANGFATITAANITPRRNYANVGDGVYLLDVLNNTAGILEGGDVVITDTSANRAAKTTTTKRDPLIMGVWLARTPAGGYGRVIQQGIGYVKTTGAATRGDYLAVSATAKSADVIASGGASTTSQARLIGMALETTTGAGLCLAAINVLASVKPANSVIKRDNNADYTSTSATFTPIDNTNFSITMDISTGIVMLIFTGGTTCGSTTVYGPTPAFDFDIDGTRYSSAGADGMTGYIIGDANSTVMRFINMTAIVTGLSAGSHTFRILWKTPGNTMTLRSGSGVAGVDSIPTFAAVEIG